MNIDHHFINNHKLGILAYNEYWAADEKVKKSCQIVIVRYIITLHVNVKIFYNMAIIFSYYVYSVCVKATIYTLYFFGFEHQKIGKKAFFRLIFFYVSL